MENVIANDRNLSALKLNVSELLDLSFLEQLAQERKAKDDKRSKRSNRSIASARLDAPTSVLARARSGLNNERLNALNQAQSAANEREEKWNIRRSFMR